MAGLRGVFGEEYSALIPHLPCYGEFDGSLIITLATPDAHGPVYVITTVADAIAPIRRQTINNYHAAT